MREKESETGEIVRGGLKMSVENESQRLTQGRERERERDEKHIWTKNRRARKENFHRHISNFPFSVDKSLLRPKSC